MEYLEEKEILGHTFRVLQPESMPVIRKKMWYGQRRDDIDWTLTKDRHRQFVKWLFSESSRIQDDPRLRLENINRASANFLTLMDNEINYDPIIEMACTVILIDDEEADNPTARFIEIKKKLCNDHLDIAFFFVETIEDLLKHSIELSATLNLWKYLAEKQSKTAENLLMASIT